MGMLRLHLIKSGLRDSFTLLTPAFFIDIKIKNNLKSYFKFLKSMIYY